MRLLDQRFKYIPSAKTDIAATWRRFGFRPTTDTERRARQRTFSSREETSPTTPSPALDIDLLRKSSRRSSPLKLVAE